MTAHELRELHLQLATMLNDIDAPICCRRLLRELVLMAARLECVQYNL